MRLRERGRLFAEREKEKERGRVDSNRERERDVTRTSERNPRKKNLENNGRTKKMKDTQRDKDVLGMEREAESGNRKRWKVCIERKNTNYTLKTKFRPRTRTKKTYIAK